MTYRCPGCKREIAREDRRKREPTLKAVAGSRLSFRRGEAPRVKCGGCHKTVVLLKGEA